MSLTKWWKQRLSKSATAMSMYKAGMEKARQRDHTGAIESYSASIEMPDLTPQLKSMVLYNRALVYAAAKDTEKAIADLHAVIGMQESPTNIKTAAQQKLDKVQRRTGKN